ncbi:MAG: GtrA family protein [Akkermansia sp.]|nr:GtrA family protein [Akkermansia sp.]MBQ8376277.1 GtrA family protein [Akkermansia sp.]
MMAPALKQTGGEFCRFFVVGVGATLLHLAVYMLLNCLFDLSEQDALGITLTYAAGYAVSFVANYVVSLRWTFRTRGSVGKGLGFAFSHLVNAGLHLLLLNLFRSLGAGDALSMLLIWLMPWLVDMLPVLARPESLLPLPVYLIVVPVNFLMVRYFLKR